MYRFIIEYASRYDDSTGLLKVNAPDAETAIRIASDNIGKDYNIIVVYRNLEI